MKHKIINAGLGLCLMGLVLGIYQPVSAGTFIDCDTYVNIRQQPSQQGNIIGYIQDGGLIQPIEEDQYGWVKIKSGDLIGWIAKQFIIFENSNNVTAKVTGDIISVKNLPQTEAITLTFLHKDDQVQCIDSNDLWTTVVLNNGEIGYVDTNMIEIKTNYEVAQTVEPSISTPQQQIQSNQLTTDKIEKIEYSDPVLSSVEDNTNYSQEQEYIEQNYYNYEQNYDYYEQNDYNYEQNYDYQPQLVGEGQEYYNYQQQYQDNSINEQYDYNYDISYQQQSSQQNNQTEYIEQQQEEEVTQTSTFNTDNSDIISYGNQFVGNPYVWGGNSLTNGIDCSHFVWQILSNTGHYDGDYAVSDGWAELGTAVDSLDDAVAGDVIVYPGHVALYDGQGSLLQARGSAYGITNDRDATYNDILAIRHFD